MQKPGRPMLLDADTSERFRVDSAGEQLESTLPIHVNVHRPPGRVWTIRACRGDLLIVLRAAIPRVDDNGMSVRSPQALHLVDERMVHEIQAAVTALKLFYLEIRPAHRHLIAIV
jgi:hypothetical protein